jgi:1-acyl-sn-glycerol-3-phosphate acyltransferase
MSKVQSPESGVTATRDSLERLGFAWDEKALQPLPEEWAVLNWFERFAFRLVRRMNGGHSKQFWTACQRILGAGWIHLATYNIMNVYGLDHIEAADRSQPILLVANHRSFFDMYAVSTVLFRQTTWRKQLFFPVRGRFFYDSPAGLFVNLVMGWWSMYPPFFASGENPLREKRAFDRFSMRVLTKLCREGPGNVIGFHPEGTRNKNDDPYSFLPAQPGVGKLIKDASPQVIPVFVTGLSNSLSRQVARNWNREEVIRIHFGPQLDLEEFRGKRDSVRTYKEISDLVMKKIANLGEADRSMYGQ